MIDVKPAVLTSLESSGQFTPEQREAIAQAISDGFDTYIDQSNADWEKAKRDLGVVIPKTDQ